jgi:hypothetical protein
MSADRDRLQSLVDALPDTEVQVAISFMAELGEQEIIDAETAAKLDLARTEPSVPGGAGTASGFPANGAGNPWQSCQSPPTFDTLRPTTGHPKIPPIRAFA